MKNRNVKLATIGNNEEQFCSNTSIYEVTYNEISRKWLVCNECLELDFFKTNIKEKVRVQT